MAAEALLRADGAPAEDIPGSIPAWCWSALRQINQAVPLGPPPPPPPPPDPDKTPSSWKLPNPMLYTTWGWQSDWVADNTMLQKAKAAGIKTIGLQGGQYGPDVPARCRAFGFKVFLWGRARSQDAEDLRVGQLDGYMPQIEGPGEHVDAMNVLRSGAGAGLSGTVTTLGAFTDFTRLPPTQSHPEGKLTTIQVEELKAVGVNYGSVEVYVQEGPHFPISNMMWAADQRGLQWAEPLVGLYWETSLNAYRPPQDSELPRRRREADRLLHGRGLHPRQLDRDRCPRVVKALARMDGWCDQRRHQIARLYWCVAGASCVLALQWLWFATPAFGFSFAAFLLSSQSVRRLTDT